MRLIVTIGFSLCLLSFVAPRAIAQYENPRWINVSPPGEAFRVSMPAQPKVEAAHATAVSGNQYTAVTSDATYTLWSFRNINYRADQDTDLYLDAAAELVWEDLLKTAREPLDPKDRLFAHMTYERELPTEGLLPGREYSLTVGPVTGTAEVFVARERIYIMLAMGKPGGDWPRESFFASFQTSLASPTAEPQIGRVITPAPVDETDPNHIFSGKEVTQKAHVLEKPEPTYTESARKFSITGTVVLRCVFSKNGEVTDVHVVRKLPHGLSQNSIAAARAIRFTPAMKDGKPVSMWMELQYNFNFF